ncbi:sugar kinase [Pseudomonas sp. REP124]|uniref:xylulokinase n=1 Tax=Pseudomonas sp. REP124 TaxID=2875731 RepID=UPI001CCDEE32|nr:FGGY family carbohydrate kinase [Pseudomonas sp. REP124]MBZ9780580.1 sugar kinase [Pseudomonas sp. REP124]
MIGVDMGTSSTRVAVIDDQGVQLAAASRPTRLLNPARQVFEQCPDEMYASVLLAIKDVLTLFTINPGEIVGISICGQMAGISTVGRGWQATTPYDSWLDMRCVQQVQRLKPYEQQIVQRSGAPVSANHAAKWLYWREEQPDTYRKIRKIIMPAAYVAGRMAALDSDAAFMDDTYLGFNSFADSQASGWNHSLIDEFQLEHDRLPQLVKPWDRIGSVSAEVASSSGLLAGTPIFAGCADIAASLLGTGAFQAGQLFDIAGTGSVLATLLDHYAADTRHNTLATFRHCIPELYYSMAYVGGAGLTLKKFGLTESECGQLELQGRSMLSERNKLLFLPHLGGCHAPFEAAFCGAFVGLDWSHDRTDQYRAMLESIAYEYARFLQCMKDMNIDIREEGIISLGGGANSQLFRQIKADVLGIPCRKLPVAESGVLGVALIAGHGAGVFADMKQTAIDWQKPVECVSLPDPSRQRFYAGMRKAYEHMLANLRPVLSDLQSVSLD